MNYGTWMDLDAKRFGRGKNAGMMRGFIDCFFYLWAWPAVKFSTVEKWYLFFTWKVLFMPSFIVPTNYYLYWHLSKMLLKSVQFISSCLWKILKLGFRAPIVFSMCSRRKIRTNDGMMYRILRIIFSSCICPLQGLENHLKSTLFLLKNGILIVQRSLSVCLFEIIILW